MTKPSPELFSAVWRHAVRIHSQHEGAYRRFVEEARSQLPENANDPQFDYIVRRIWMEDGPEAQEYWEQSLMPGLRSQYLLIEDAMDWNPEGSLPETWITPQLVQRTLSVWQKRLPIRIDVEHAVRMLRSTGRVGDLGVQV